MLRFYYQKRRDTQVWNITLQSWYSESQTYTIHYIAIYATVQPIRTTTQKDNNNFDLLMRCSPWIKNKYMSSWNLISSFENQGIDKWILWYVAWLSNQTERLIIDEPWRYSVWDLDIQKSSNFTENFSSQCKVQLYIMHM